MGIRKSAVAIGTAVMVCFCTTSCHVRVSSGPDSDADTSVFLDALSGPIRNRYSDSELIAEGRKACDALNAGKSNDDVKAMIEQDLGLDPRTYPNASGQFIGAVYAGFDCT